MPTIGTFRSAEPRSAILAKFLRRASRNELPAHIDLKTSTTSCGSHVGRLASRAAPVNTCSKLSNTTRGRAPYGPETARSF